MIIQYNKKPIFIYVYMHTRRLNNQAKKSKIKNVYTKNISNFLKQILEQKKKKNCSCS